MSVLSGELGNKCQKEFKHVEGCLEKASNGNALRDLLPAGRSFCRAHFSPLIAFQVAANSCVKPLGSKFLWEEAAYSPFQLFCAFLFFQALCSLSHCTPLTLQLQWIIFIMIYLSTQICHFSSTFFSYSIRNFTCKHFPPAFPWRSSWILCWFFFWFAGILLFFLHKILNNLFFCLFSVSFRKAWAHMSFSNSSVPAASI